MKNIFKAIFYQVNLILNDSNYRMLLYKPFFKGMRAFILIFLSCIILTYAGCYLKDLFFLNETSWVYVLTNFLIILLLPPILAFLYFSLFCEKEYCDIAFYCFDKCHDNDSSKVKFLAKNNNSFSTFLLQSIAIIIIMFFCLIASFFLPLLGLIVAGLVLFWDFSSYFFINNEISYKARVSFIYKNIFSIFIISTFLAFICLIPFSILFFYPIGVGLTTYLVASMLKDES